MEKREKETINKLKFLVNYTLSRSAEGKTCGECQVCLFGSVAFDRPARLEH